LDLLVGQLKAPGANLPPLNGNGNGNHIHLPSLELPTFYGNANQFFSFWEAFEQSVGLNGNLNNSQKLTYLFSLLRGPARAVVEGLSLEAANYQIAVDLLFGRYGNEGRRAEVLQNELIKLPKALSHHSSLRMLSESIERICRQLSTHGVDLNTNPFLISTLKEKLPSDVLTRLVEKEMDGGVVWTPLQWRNGLIKEVKIREAAIGDTPTFNDAPQTQSNHECPNRQFHPINDFRRQENNSSKSLVRSFSVVTNPRKRFFAQSANPSSGHSILSVEPGPSRTAPAKASVFCSLCRDFGHLPTHCPTYPTPDDRQLRIQQQNRCLICCSADHSADRCTAHVVCMNCRGAHHIMFCPTGGAQ
jgi:hypothetical protein